LALVVQVGLLKQYQETETVALLAAIAALALGPLPVAVHWEVAVKQQRKVQELQAQTLQTRLQFFLVLQQLLHFTQLLAVRVQQEFLEATGIKAVKARVEALLAVVLLRFRQHSTEVLEV
jgi:hypothetical protein